MKTEWFSSFWNIVTNTYHVSFILISIQSLYIPEPLGRSPQEYQDQILHLRAPSDFEPAVKEVAPKNLPIQKIYLRVLT